jgi:hypothetical protein
MALSNARGSDLIGGGGITDCAISHLHFFRDGYKILTILGAEVRRLPGGIGASTRNDDHACEIE